MDVLSETLNVVQLTGTVFYNPEFSAPWCFWWLGGSREASRSALVDTLRRYVASLPPGETPMAYLTLCRLQFGARILVATGKGVAQIASQVGYESEPAFAHSNGNTGFRPLASGSRRS